MCEIIIVSPFTVSPAHCLPCSLYTPPRSLSLPSFTISPIHCLRIHHLLVQTLPVHCLLQSPPLLRCHSVTFWVWNRFQFCFPTILLNLLYSFIYLCSTWGYESISEPLACKPSLLQIPLPSLPGKRRYLYLSNFNPWPRLWKKKHSHGGHTDCPWHYCLLIINNWR